jgi:hypothetical protein
VNPNNLTVKGGGSGRVGQLEQEEIRLGDTNGHSHNRKTEQTQTWDWFLEAAL